jgi:hypothetical protein
MSLQDVVACAPFRLSKPRPVTEYEWGVIQTAMEETQIGNPNLARSSGYGLPVVSVEVAALIAAIRARPCPGPSAWKYTAFGPAPAVDLRRYKCFAWWYFGLDVPARANALRDIATGANELGLHLCNEGVVNLDACPPSMRGADGPGEYVFQTSRYPADQTPCAATRARTIYLPMTGRKALDLGKMLGATGQLPPEWLQMASLAPAAFMDREFLVGLQMKPNVDYATILAAVMRPGTTPGGLVLMAPQVFEEVALIWAPGKGASMMSMLTGGLDPVALLALLQQIMPDLLGEWGNALPGLMQQLPGLLSIPGLAQALPELMKIPGLADQLAQLLKIPGFAEKLPELLKVPGLMQQLPDLLKTPGLAQQLPELLKIPGMVDQLPGLAQQMQQWGPQLQQLMAVANQMMPGLLGQAGK